MMAVEAENDCPICQETLHGPSSVGCTVPCGHLFHRRCFETWQMHSTAKRCPCCNVDLMGFIDKIHISLPGPPSNLLDDSEVKLERRKALSSQKSKRSSMMRHKNRRRQAVPEMEDSEERNPIQESRAHGATAAKQARSVSLSASLQRAPPDPVKSAELERAEERECPSISSEVNGHAIVTEVNDHDIGIHRLSLCDELFAGVEHLEDQIPNVADKIMRNIERTLRQPVASSKKPPVKQLPSKPFPNSELAPPW